MDDGWNVVFGVVLLAGAAYLFGPDMMIRPSSDRINAYFVDTSSCVTNQKYLQFCDATRVGTLEMSVDKNTSSVNTKVDIATDVRKLLTEDQNSQVNKFGISSLENCKIFDKSNWSCGQIEMTDGFLSTPSTGTLKWVSGWEYRLLGLGAPLLLYDQK